MVTRAAGRHGVIQMIPTLSSCNFDEIIDAKKGDQIQWLQLYVSRGRGVMKGVVQHAEKTVCKGLFITVDAQQLGRREKGNPLALYILIVPPNAKLDRHPHQV